LERLTPGTTQGRSLLVTGFAFYYWYFAPEEAVDEDEVDKGKYDAYDPPDEANGLSIL
jgi:hypothetical protein